MSERGEKIGAVETASSTLVNVAEHAELRLVRILSEQCEEEDEKKKVSPEFTTDCERCIANADAPGLIRRIIGDEGAVSSLYRIDPLEECVSAFSLLAALLEKVGGTEEEGVELTLEMADAVDVGSYDMKKRIALLCCLYNLRSDGEEKCGLLCRIVKLCSSSEEQRNMLSRGHGGPLAEIMEVGNVVHMLEEWNVSVPCRRRLYRALADAMEVSADDDAAIRRQRFLLLDVETYTDASKLDKEGIHVAKEAALGAIRDPVKLFTQQRGMLALPPIAALQKSADTKPLYSLLQIFQQGNLQDYQSFVSANPNVFSTYSLSPETSLRHMRLLSLCSLAAELPQHTQPSNHTSIPYSLIASTLQIPLEQVESWVIACVSANLLSAKMDQLQQLVMVESYVVRNFDLQQWKLLQKRLNDWKSNVSKVLEALKKQQTIMATAGNLASFDSL